MRPVEGTATLWRSGIHTLATSAASVLISLAASILVARSLGPTAKGGYDLMLASGALASLLLGFSLAFGATYTVARRISEPGALMRRLGPFSMIQGFLVSLAVIASSDAAVAGVLIPRDLAPLAVVPLGFYVALTSGASYLRGVLVGQQRIITANNGDLLGRVATPIGIAIVVGVALAAGLRPDATLFLWCVVGGLGLTSAYFVRALWRDLGSGRGPSGIRTVIRYSFPAYLANLLQFLNYRLDLFLVASLIGVRAVGLYALAVSLAQLIWLVSNSAAVVLLPRVASEVDTPADNARRVAQVARLVLLISLVAGLGVAVLAPVLLPLVYGLPFRESVEPLIYLLPGVIAFSVVNVLASYIAGVGRPQINLIVSGAGLAITLILDLTLIPAIGIRGAALASTMSYLLSTLLTVAIFARMTGLRPIEVLVPTAADARLGGRLVTDLARLWRAR